MKRVLFISSTGGHYNELMQLKPLFEKYNYHIITEKWDKSSFNKIHIYFIYKLLDITFLLYKI